MIRASICLVWATMMALLAMPDRTMAQTIGSTGTDISGANARSQETSAGNLVTDALRAATGADAAVIPADAFTSATIAKGTVSCADLKSLLDDPGDEIAVITLTGDELRAALERSVRVHPKPFDGFLQVSGLIVEFDSGRGPGPRLLNVTVNGAPLKPDGQYRLATTSTLAGGALGYYHIWSDANVARTRETVIDAVCGYVKARKSIAPRVEGRLAPK